MHFLQDVEQHPGSLPTKCESISPSLHFKNQTYPQTLLNIPGRESTSPTWLDKRCFRDSGFTFGFDGRWASAALIWKTLDQVVFHFLLLVPRGLNAACNYMQNSVWGVFTCTHFPGEKIHGLMRFVSGSENPLLLSLPV